MYNVLLLEKQRDDLLLLKSKIEKFCPCLEIIGLTNTLAQVPALLKEKKPDLIFMNPEFISCDEIRKSLGSSGSDTELIFVSQTGAHALDAINRHAVGYLIKPVQENDLIATVEEARMRVWDKEQRRRDKLLLEKLFSRKQADELIGIPTMEGFDFLPVNEIIRCEGLQKCTRVVTTTKTDIISSYNIGEFRKLLEPYHFFSPHKSHLINLAFIKKYRRDGTIHLRDNSNVPISKRKKSEFLEQVVHL